MCLRNAGHNDGLTLTELLTVVAIVAVISSISVPAFMQMGFYTMNRPVEGARELYILLRAARVYAATYGVIAGVVYSRDLPDDVSQVNKFTMNVINNPEPKKHPYVNSMAIVRVFKEEEIKKLNINTPKNESVVPVQNDNGIFLPFLDGLCLRLSDEYDANENSLKVNQEKSALGNAYLYDEKGHFFDDNRICYGHFFKPSGEIINPHDGQLTGGERFSLYVSSLPIEDEENMPKDIEKIRIGFIRATGRIWIEGD